MFVESLKSRVFDFFQTSYKSLFFAFPKFADALIYDIKTKKKKKLKRWINMDYVNIFRKVLDGNTTTSILIWNVWQQK